MADSEEPAASALEEGEPEQPAMGEDPAAFEAPATEDPEAEQPLEETDEQQPPAREEAAVENPSAGDITAVQESPTLEEVEPEGLPTDSAAGAAGNPQEVHGDDHVGPGPELTPGQANGNDIPTEQTGEAEHAVGSAGQDDLTELQDVLEGGDTARAAGDDDVQDSTGAQKPGQEEMAMAALDADNEEDPDQDGDEPPDRKLAAAEEEEGLAEVTQVPKAEVPEDEELPVGELSLQPQLSAGGQEPELFHTAYYDIPLEPSADEEEASAEPQVTQPLPVVSEDVEEIVRLPAAAPHAPGLAGTGYMPQEVLIYAPQQQPASPAQAPAEPQQPAQPPEAPEPRQAFSSPVDSPSPGPASPHRQSFDSPTTLPRSRHPSSARPMSASPMSASQRLAVGSGAMAVRGRLAAATSREAVLKQEAEMAAADLDIMRVEKAALEAELEQEASLRRSLEDELEQVLQQLEKFQEDPYKDKWREAEARLKVAYAQNSALEEQMKTLQVEAARDRAVAEVAERKREASETRRDAAERKVQEMQRRADREALDKQHRETLRPATAAPLADFGGGYTPGNAVVDEIRSLKGALDQAQRTNAALVQAELERSGLVESPQEGLERRLRMLENTVASPMSSPNRRRLLGGGAAGALGWDGGAGMANGMYMGHGMGMMGGPGSPMGMQMGLMPSGQPVGNGMMMMMPTSPSGRMQYALQQMDSHLHGGMNGGMMRPMTGGYGNYQQQHQPYASDRYGGMMPEPATPSHQQYQAFPESSPFHNVPPSATRSERFERSLRGSTRESYAGQDTRPPPAASGYGGPSVERNTNPNQMHEEALKAARIQYHQEKMRMMDLQLQRQANPNA